MPRIARRNDRSGHKKVGLLVQPAIAFAYAYYSLMAICTTLTATQEVACAGGTKPDSDIMFPTRCFLLPSIPIEKKNHFQTFSQLHVYRSTAHSCSSSIVCWYWWWREKGHIGVVRWLGYQLYTCYRGAVQALCDKLVSVLVGYSGRCV